MFSAPLTLRGSPDPQPAGRAGPEMECADHLEDLLYSYKITICETRCVYLHSFVFFQISTFNGCNTFHLLKSGHFTLHLKT